MLIRPRSSSALVEGAVCAGGWFVFVTAVFVFDTVGAVVFEFVFALTVLVFAATAVFVFVFVVATAPVLVFDRVVFAVGVVFVFVVGYMVGVVVEFVIVVVVDGCWLMIFRLTDTVKQLLKVDQSLMPELSYARARVCHAYIPDASGVRCA